MPVVMPTELNDALLGTDSFADGSPIEVSLPGALSEGADIVADRQAAAAD